ncbi:shikimate kinase AroK [soil metagenome]
MSIPHPPGLALIGYRGSGKSTVGRLLADRLGRPFVDADKEIEARAGRSIASIFANQGEAAFRDLEAAVLLDLIGRTDGAVLATGGGVILRESNREALRRYGFVAWLTADPETLVKRLGSDPAGRPALTSSGLLGEINEVLESRSPLYRAVADLSVDTSKDHPAEVAEAVLVAWKQWAEGPGASP